MTIRYTQCIFSTEAGARGEGDDRERLGGGLAERNEPEEASEGEVLVPDDL